MFLQGSLISVRGQKILYWKLGRGYYFGSNGSIYIFNIIFLYTVFLKKKIIVYLLIYLYIYLYILTGSD